MQTKFSYREQGRGMVVKKKKKKGGLLSINTTNTPVTPLMTEPEFCSVNGYIPVCWVNGRNGKKILWVAVLVV